MLRRLSRRWKACLVILVKYPEPGKVKTRLGREMGMNNAALLYRDFVARLLATCREVSCPVLVSCHPDRRISDYQKWLRHEYGYIVQRGNDLGMIMQDSFEQAFARGFSRVVLMGSDIPQLPADYIEKALDKLEEIDVVLGPAVDGGYYLLGMNRPSFSSKIFADIPWSTPEVLGLTLKAVRDSNLTEYILPCLRDIDTLDDLNALKNYPAMVEKKPAGKSSAEELPAAISVIIPVYREHKTINSFLNSLAKIFPDPRHEIIVVDGGPGHETLAALDVANIIALSSDRGRGKQMNAGAQAAQGRILLFLHADTILPDNASELIINAMQDRNIMAGSFSLGIDSKKCSLKVIELFGNIRSWWTRVPYGDQAIFMARDQFLEIGGFRDMPIMEDLEIMTRLRKMGKKIVILPEKARTSSRRWDREGALRGTLRNWIIRTLYHFGVSPDIISRYYK